MGSVSPWIPGLRTSDRLPLKLTPPESPGFRTSGIQLKLRYQGVPPTAAFDPKRTFNNALTRMAWYGRSWPKAESPLQCVQPAKLPSISGTMPDRPLPVAGVRAAYEDMAASPDAAFAMPVISFAVRERDGHSHSLPQTIVLWPGETVR